MVVLRFITNWWAWPLFFVLWTATVVLLTDLYRDAFESSTSSNKQWLTIWQNKGDKANIRDDEPLHHLNGLNA